MQKFLGVLCLLGLICLLGYNKLGLLSKSDPTVQNSQPQSDVVIIKNVRIFPSAEGEVLEDVFLVFENNKILKITKSLTEVSAFENALVVDGEDKTIIPQFLTDTIPQDVLQKSLEKLSEISADEIMNLMAIRTESLHEEDQVVTISDELIYLVNHGVAPKEALRIATIEVAKSMEQEPKGFLSEGNEVNFIMFSGNPLTNINRVNFIYEIWEEGKLILHDEAQKSSAPTMQDL